MGEAKDYLELRRSKEGLHDLVLHSIDGAEVLSRDNTFSKLFNYMMDYMLSNPSSFEKVEGLEGMRVNEVEAITRLQELAKFRGELEASKLCRRDFLQYVGEKAPHLVYGDI